KVIHISVLCCGVGFEFSLRNCVLLWRVLQWTVLIDSSLVGLTVLIEIIALKMILEHVHLENPLSSSRTLSSMKNLEDNFTFSDQFINDKPTKEDMGKTNIETKVESMVTVPIHQESSSIPLLSTLVIDLTPPKPVSSIVQEPGFTTTTTTTPQHQSSIDSALAICVTALEHICANFEKKNKMKEILRDQMFKCDSYRSLPEHIALYEALEASMDRDNMEEFMDAMAKSRKRCCNNQDPLLLPPKDSDQSKKKRHDTDAFALQHPQAQTSSVWKTTDTRDVLSSSSKHKPDSQSK
nr:hypothetical protein [Tanacetum cinerariifolium]